MELIDKTKLRYSIVDFMYTEHSEVGHEREFEVLQAVLRTIDAQPQVMRWIPVTERLPEEGKNVLAVCYGAVRNITFIGAIQIACYFDDGGWLIEGYEEMENPKVTHWMELPKFETDVEEES